MMNYKQLYKKVKIVWKSNKIKKQKQLLKKKIKSAKG